jgi:adenine-specific DNA-methyltransferase
MASLQKTYTQPKLLGQVYTPPFIVDKMLADLGFDPSAGSRILDPACGDGRFLVEIVRRIVAHAPPERVVSYLANVHGWDIDPEAVADCVARLDAVVAKRGLAVRWNIQVLDSIEKITEPIEKTDRYDLIVGNPPYIRIQHLPEPTRRFVQAHYAYCRSGSTDIFIAFFELAQHLLAADGVCGFITPNTFFYTETARAFRADMLRRGTLRHIANYGDIQVFDDATTYSAITIFDQKKRDTLRYERATSRVHFEEKKIDLARLDPTGGPWRLSTDDLPDAPASARRLGEVCRIHVGIMTLCDKAFIFSVKNTDDASVVLAESRLGGAVLLEKAVLRPIVKASTLKSGDEPIREMVLFPYEKRGGKHAIMAESDLRTRYPLAYAYLCRVRPALDARDAGKPNAVAWYAFGRSQGLETSFGPKILFSPMNQRPNFVFHPDSESTFYSGYCIKYEGDVTWLLSQLNSERMQQFVAVSSRDFRGGWKAYNKKMLEDFPLEIPAP